MYRNERRGESMLYIEYPKCSTCKKAKKYLEEKSCQFDTRDIVLDSPTKEELKKWVKMSELPLKRFFNTSGMKYRELNMAQRFKELSEEQLYDLLASDGMLVKRPILVGEDFVKVAFKEKEWEDL